jgi:surfeit locus 1 family protein
MTPSPSDQSPAHRSRIARTILAIVLFVLFSGFSALGIWQVERLSWKLDLIARVEARIHATPIAPPGRSQWVSVNAGDHEYLHVRATGTFDYGKDTLVQATTALGPGFWVMTPLALADGSTILVNRGFVPSDRKKPGDRRQGDVAGPVTVTGLLRITEPKGAFLRSNDPVTDRWFSRDVPAIATRQGIATAAPYFIDADASHNAGGLPVGGLPVGGLPVGGLTVVRFPNSHLVYAITWFAMALMTAGAGLYVWRLEKRSRGEKAKA